ncbi:MAG: hypothetical protein EU533_02150 [Promethearchaeota archaeon]|nr:MAG: hypothetical protein EU533_02150 [Candidatus Lokiarchaeota archaeon]
MLDFFDLMFIVSGMIFFISMIGAFILMAHEKMKTVLISGVILAVLMLPIIVVLIGYVIVGKDLVLIIYTILILSYLVAEFLLDRVFKIDFRSKASQHVPYIILEWAAAFSFLYGTRELDMTMFAIIAIFFWVFVAALVYYLILQRKSKKKDNN